MNKETLKGDFNQLKGSIKEQWSKLTEDDLTSLEGSFDKLVGKVQERYGHAKEVVEKEVSEWRTKHDI